MSFRGRPKKSCLSNEELQQQRAEREMAQEKAKREKAEKRKMKNKGYGQSQERKPYNRRESEIPGEPMPSRRETSNFGARFPVKGQSTTASLVLNNEQPHDMESETSESISEKMLETPQIFPADYTKEFIDNQEECINFLKFTEKDYPTEPVKPIKKKEKKILDDEVESGWDETMTEAAYKAAVEVYGCKWSCCHVCFSKPKVIVKCTDCRLAYCSECDEKQHSANPFCHRTLHCKDSERWIKSQSLLPTQFLNCLDGTVESKAVPVPMFPAGPCPECSKVGVLGNVVVTSDSKVHWCSVVTKDGVFDLNAPVYRCNQRNTCNYNREIRLEDFISSGYFPGNPNNFRLLFSTKLLKMWHHVSLLTPGTSLTQFSNALSSTSQDAGLSAIINSSMFQSASKACAYVNHLIDKRVKVIKKRWCRACTSELTDELEPHSSHVDGNLKLCRRFREKQKKGKCWFEDNEMITSQAELQRVKEEVAKVRPQGKNTLGSKCGNSEFLAMKEVSSRFKNLDTAGIVMASCPHGSVLDAVDMCEGETFRHTLIPHLKLSKMNCKFLVNDVICKYWPFAQFLAKELKGEYTHLTTNIQGFLSRLHGQCHGWDCQILYFGHWKQGAGAILGEEAEQVFSFFSRYNTVTKVMSEGGRIFFLTLAIFYWNMRKERILARLICTRLLTAIHRIQFYRDRLDSQLAKRGLTEEQLPEIHRSLEKRATDYRKSSQAEKEKSKLEKLQAELESLVYEHSNLVERITTVASSSKWKTHIRSKITKLCTKVKTKIAKINELMKQAKKKEKEMARLIDPSGGAQSVDDDEDIEINEVTFQHFTDGIFPWESPAESSFKEDFKLIDTWMLLQRNKEQPKQSMKEMRQLLCSFKSSIQKHKNEIEEIIKAESDLNHQRDASFDEATVNIKTAEIKRLKNLLHEALKYAKYYNNLDTTEFENVINDDELEEDECLMDDNDESDEENLLDCDV